MSSAATTGLFAIGGVIVGSGLNLTSGIVLDRRRERRNLRSAARMIHSELKTIEVELRSRLGTGANFQKSKTAQWVERKQDIGMAEQSRLAISR